MLTDKQFNKVIEAMNKFKSFAGISIAGSNTDDFKEFIKDRLYVDKSLLIKEVLDSKSHMFMSAPQRWGKSLNLSMLKYFFQPEVDKNGNFNFSIPGNNRKLFEGGTVVLSLDKSRELKVLKIANVNDGKYLKEQGQYPVIYLNFKCVSGQNTLEIQSSLRSAICDAYKEHDYLLRRQIIKEIQEHNDINGTSISTDGKSLEYLQKAMTKIHASHNLIKLKLYYNGVNGEEAPLTQSIKFLSFLLREHYCRKVFVLVDEFDKPVHNLLKRIILNKDDKNNTKGSVEEIAKLISSVVGGEGKGVNPNIDKIILTGILNTVDLEVSSTLNGIQEKSIMTGGFTDYFGFSKTELQEQVLDLISHGGEICIKIYMKN